MVDVEIRATHPFGFRSGQWAKIMGIRWVKDRPCYRILFPDGESDEWPIQDDLDPYEFRALEEIVPSPDKKPLPSEAPHCQYPRWSTHDKIWLCCHGGINCGGCSAWPANCKPPKIDVPDYMRYDNAN